MSIEADISDIICKFRRIQRIVESDRFLSAFGRAAPEEQKQVELLAMSGKEYDLEAWIQKKNRKLEVWLFSLRELRAKARELRIPNYSHLSKAMLQSEVLSYGKKAGSSIDSSTGAGSINPEPASSS